MILGSRKLRTIQLQRENVNVYFPHWNGDSVTIIEIERNYHVGTYLCAEYKNFSLHDISVGYYLSSKNGLLSTIEQGTFVSSDMEVFLEKEELNYYR